MKRVSVLDYHKDLDENPDLASRVDAAADAPRVSRWPKFLAKLRQVAYIVLKLSLIPVTCYGVFIAVQSTNVSLPRSCYLGGDSARIISGTVRRNVSYGDGLSEVSVTYRIDGKLYMAVTDHYGHWQVELPDTCDRDAALTFTREGYHQLTVSQAAYSDNDRYVMLPIGPQESPCTK